MWSEERVFALPIGEDYSFERKGAKLLDVQLSEVKEANVRRELAKQLSAFANSGGGSIIYGVNNQNQIDNGGISRARGHGTVKEWLEDVIPHSTEPPIAGFQVIEILPRSEERRVGKECRL